MDYLSTLQFESSINIAAVTLFVQGKLKRHISRSCNAYNIFGFTFVATRSQEVDCGVALTEITTGAKIDDFETIKELELKVYMLQHGKDSEKLKEAVRKQLLAVKGLSAFPVKLSLSPVHLIILNLL